MRQNLDKYQNGWGTLIQMFLHLGKIVEFWSSPKIKLRANEDPV